MSRAVISTINRRLVDPCLGWWWRGGGWPVPEPCGVCCEGLVERGLAGGGHGEGCVVVDVGGMVVADAREAVFLRGSGIGFHTPADVHYERAPAIREQRGLVLDAAYAAHPERFVRKAPEPPKLPAAVWINEPKEDPTTTQ